MTTTTEVYRKFIHKMLRMHQKTVSLQRVFMCVFDRD